MFDDTYKEIEAPSVGVYKEKGSKFIAYSYPVYSVEEIKKKIEETKKLEYAAKHHCYAYILNYKKTVQRANDDGEPSSTAGKPILGQILSKDLTNILIIVVRYFGGVKLGVPGLIRSYKTAANNAILNSIIISKIIKEEYEVSFRYPQMNSVMRLVKKFDLEVIDTNFQTECKLIFAVAKSKADNTIYALKKNHKVIIKCIKTI